MKTSVVAPVADSPAVPQSTAAPVAAAPATAAPSDAAASQVDLERRFGGIARLYGARGLARFRAARVCVVGLGGVGSWVVEALARSAIGHLTLIDLDHLAESNLNRQIHALTDTLGMAKVTALAQRIAQINPVCVVGQVEAFLDAGNVAQLIGADRFDYIVDAIDDAAAKTALIAWCRANRLRLVTIGGAGGQIDPTCITVRDLCRTEQEPLLAKVRKRLRREHGFPRGTKNKFGIDAVFSTEPLRMPMGEEACAIAPPADDPADGDLDTALETRDAQDARDDDSPDADDAQDAQAGVSGLNCAGYGSAVAVTATFGLVAAAHVLRRLADPVPTRAPLPVATAQSRSQPAVDTYS